MARRVIKKERARANVILEGLFEEEEIVGMRDQKCWKFARTKFAKNDDFQWSWK